MPRGYRTGSIDLETAKKIFNNYYDNRASSPIGRLRAKLFDKMYQKKPRFLLKPGTPGSAKYALEEGPRTFDMEGVDYFPEGEDFMVENGSKPSVKAKSKGATFYKRGVDSDVGLEDIGNGKFKSDKIYGPRIIDSDELYNKHFKSKYTSRKSRDLSNQNIIDIYWEKYREDPAKYKRKNSKSSKNRSRKEEEEVEEEEVVEEEKEKEEEEEGEGLEGAQFEFNNKTYQIGEDLVIRDEDSEILGTLSEMDVGMKNYLIDNKIVFELGDDFIYLNDENDKNKLYTFKNPTDNMLIKIQLSSNQVFTNESEPLGMDLDEYLSQDNIDIANLIFMKNIAPVSIEDDDDDSQLENSLKDLSKPRDNEEEEEEEEDPGWGEEEEEEPLKNVKKGGANTTISKQNIDKQVSKLVLEMKKEHEKIQALFTKKVQSLLTNINITEQAHLTIEYIQDGMNDIYDYSKEALDDISKKSITNVLESIQKSVSPKIANINIENIVNKL